MSSGYAAQVVVNSGSSLGKGSVTGRRTIRQPQIATTRPWILLVLIGVIVYRVHELLPASWLFFRPALLSAVLGLPLLLQGAALIDRQAMPRHRVVQLTVCYVLWAACTIPLAIWKGGAWERVFGMLPLLTVIIGFALVPATQQTYQVICRCFVLFAVLLAVGAIAQNQRVVGRLTVTYSFDPNSLAAMMALSAPFAAADAFRSRGVMRFANLGALSLISWVLLQTQSRGSLIGYAVGMIAFVLFQPPRFRKWAFALAVLLSLVTWTVAPAEFLNRLSSSTEDYNRTERGGRVQIWTRGLSYFADNPLTGVGAGNFETAEGEYNKENGFKGKWSAPHNTLVEVFAELGLPGGSLLIWLFSHSVIIAMGRTRNDRRPELVSALVATAVSGMFLGLAYFWGLFALFGLALLVGRGRYGVSPRRGLPNRRVSRAANI